MTQAFNLSQLANKVNTSGQLDASTGLVNITPVANGGTGRSSVTSGNLLLGAGTGAMTLLAGSTPGQGVLWNGTAWTAGSLVGTAPIVNEYVAPGTWTKPATLVGIKVTVVGGGGNSVASPPVSPPSTPSATGAGGGGGAAIRWLPAGSIPGPIAITAGTGTNSFGALASATAGASGSGNNGGAGGIGSSGDVNIQGGGGNVGFAQPGTGFKLVGAGGNSIFGGGGAGKYGPAPAALPANPGGNYGGGASGSGGTAGTGAPGIVIVEEFY